MVCVQPTGLNDRSLLFDPISVPSRSEVTSQLLFYHPGLQFLALGLSLTIVTIPLPCPAPEGKMEWRVHIFWGTLFCAWYFAEFFANASHFIIATTLLSSPFKNWSQKTFWRDPWVVQRFSACLWPRAQSWRPGIESHVRLPAGSLLLPLPVSLPLSVSLINK